MAFRVTGYYRSILSQLGKGRAAGIRSFASSTTSQSNRHRSKYAITGEYAPIYLVMGMVVVAISIGTHTAKQQLLHHPSVNFRKKRRESVEEVEDPDSAISSSDKFLNKSFLRKIANIQNDKRTLTDPSRPDPFSTPRNAVSLKNAGVDSRH